MDFRDRRTHSPLHMAICHNQSEVVEMLLELGANTTGVFVFVRAHDLRRTHARTHTTHRGGHVEDSAGEHV